MATFSAALLFSLLYLANAGPITFSRDAPLYNEGLFGGDMVVSPSEAYNAIVDAKKLWKNGIVYYNIGESAKVIREYILAGIEEYHQKTCLRFVEVEPDEVPDYIEIGWYSGCSSMVGRTGGKQYMSLGSGCHWKGLVVHEFGHAIGFYHEQARSDRDAYIEVLWDNILDGYQDQFNKMKYYEHNFLGEKFDYKSVMLYEETAFSKDGVLPTVKVLREGQVIGPVWKKDGLSDSDVRRINRLYQCNGEVRPPPPEVPDFLCTFENDDCGIVNQENMGSDFERRYGNIAGKQGHMMVMDVSRTGSVGARLITPHYSLYGREKGCFSFDYLMEGEDVYKFDIYKQGAKGTEEIYQTKSSEPNWNTFYAEINEEDGDPRAMGGALLGLTMWMLGTSPAVKRFFSGTLYFTYVLLCLGSLMFITGLFGWIGSYKRGGCLMKMFLTLSVLTVASEIGGIVALNVLRMKMADILETGWNEVNQPSKNMVQESFSCCGFRGPKEFAHNSDPIDDSCYAQQLNGASSSSTTDNGASTTQILEVRRLNRNGCKEKMVEWFYNHKVIWIVALGLLLLFQVTSILMSVYVLNQRKRADNGSSTQSLPIVQSYL